MKKAVIITENKYPSGDAGAIRQHSFAKMFEYLGFSVLVVGYGESTNGKLIEYDGIRYISFRTKSKNIVFRILNRIVFGLRTIKFLKQYACDADAIMVVDTLPYAFNLIRRFASDVNSILIHDSVEWYSPEEYANGKKNIQFRLKEKTNCEVIGKGWRVIAISRFLHEHFSRKADKTIRIPVIMDIEHIPFSICNKNDKIVFLYAGNPGLKDNLKDIIFGFSLLSKEQLEQVELRIIGVSKFQLFNECGVDVKAFEEIQESLKIYGRISRDNVIDQVMSADYTILLRHSKLRYAKAGFPTKIVESLACGTPPMCNLSSDLAEYLEDGKNSVIINGETPIAVKEAIMKAISYKEENVNLRLKARKTAEVYFDYHCYLDVFKQLLKD